MEKERKGRGREKKRKKKRAFPLFIEALLEWPVKIYHGKPSGKMTRAALDLSGMVVLARTHSKLESIFLLCGCVGGGGGANGQGQDRKWQESNG